MNSKQLAAAERTLSSGTWAITAGAVLFSVLTVTPLVQRVTPDSWDWTAPILPLVVDAAVIIVVRLDATVSRLGGDGGAWPTILRWLTGLLTLALNVGDSALKSDMVGVAVHCVAPLLLIVTSEAALAYRRAIARALTRIADEQEQREARERQERAAREQRERADRERERSSREQREREAREQAERLERERLDREERQQREQREHEAQIDRERAERAAQERREAYEREQAEREAAERRANEQAERERRDREANEQAERQARERERSSREQRTARPVNTPASRPVNTNKVGEDKARRMVREGAGTRSVRELAADTGWSVGWVSARLSELTPAGDVDQEQQPAAVGGAR